MIRRQLYGTVRNHLFRGKAIVIVGARQVGKTTLFKSIVAGADRSSLMLDCDEPSTREILANANLRDLNLLLGDKKIVVVDEAQRVENIGLTLKLITDHRPDCQLLVTGSSSLDLRGNINEPLTGRKYEYMMYPISTKEIMDTDGLLGVRQSLDSRLIYGSYPDILTHQGDARELLLNLAGSYLYKDILKLDSVRKPELLEKILVALALQVGSEVSYNEIAKTVGSDSKTVERYIGLLEDCFVIFRLNALSRNIRNELKKSRKIFFYDNGIRNALLQNFAPLELRSDRGALWENFFISERLKFNHYRGSHARIYFWRTADRQEIDYVEEEDGAFRLFEMKVSPKKAATALPAIFLRNYNVVEQAIVTPENYYQYLI